MLFFIYLRNLIKFYWKNEELWLYYGYSTGKFGKPVSAAAGFFREFLKKSRFRAVRHLFGLALYIKTGQMLNDVLRRI